MWLLILVLVLLLLVAFVALFAFHKAVDRPAPLDFGDKAALMKSSWFAYEPLLTPAVQWVDQQPWQDVAIQGADGVALHGLWLPADKADMALLLFHGYASLPHNDFCLTARWAKKKGYSVFLAQQRGYGKSGGSSTALGLLEAEDCRRWAAYFAEKLGPGVKLVLGGVSMGATTVLFAASGPLPETVRALSVDCGYRSVKGVIKHIVKTYLRMRSFPLVQLVCLFGRLRWGVWPGKLDTVEIMKQNQRLPVFFAHGKADTTVPYTMTKEAYDACAAPKHLFTCEDAGHGASALVETERYFTEMEAFLKPYLV